MLAHEHEESVQFLRLAVVDLDLAAQYRACVTRRLKIPVIDNAHLVSNEMALLEGLDNLLPLIGSERRRDVDVEKLLDVVPGAVDVLE